MKVKPWKQRDGFTLLEVLVSLTILSLIMLIIFSAFHLGQRAWSRGERDIETNQRFRVAIQMLIQDISSTYNFRTRISNQWLTLFIGKPDRILFISALGSPFSAGAEVGLHQVEYYLGDDEERGGKALIRREYPVTNGTPFDKELSEELIILPWIEEVKFEYLYRKPLRRTESLRDAEEEWVEYWGGVTGDSIDDLRLAINPGMNPDIARASRRFLPVAVKITFTFSKQAEVLIHDVRDFPPVVIPIGGRGSFR